MAAAWVREVTQLSAGEVVSIDGQSLRGSRQTGKQQDVAFHEDQSRKRAAHAAQNFSVMNRIALNRLCQDKSVKVGIRGKRLVTGWDNNFLLRLLRELDASALAQNIRRLTDLDVTIGRVQFESRSVRYRSVLPGNLHSLVKMLRTLDLLGRFVGFPGRIAALAATLVFGLAAGAQLSPGPLARPHANLGTATQCAKCHAIGTRGTFKCLECHTEIARRMVAHEGLHAAETPEKCARCHSDHNGPDFPLIVFDPKSFDHRKSGYPLDGKHAGLDCKRCHAPKFIPAAERARLTSKNLDRTYLGLSRICASCHEDKHHKQFTKDCGQCHSVTGWKTDLRFDHNKSRYPLTGAHAQVRCEKCHPAEGADHTVKYVPLKFGACVDCHKDVHRGSFTKPCESCHTVAAWKQIRAMAGFDHGKTKYALEGKHATVACVDCHRGGDFKKPVAFTLCMDCHKPDPHGGQFAQRAGGECGPCHTLQGFKTPEPKYNVAAHAASNYPLEAKHAEVTCAKCHLPAGRNTRYEIAYARCVDCHKDAHSAQFDRSPGGNRCEDCHDLKGFKPATFTLARHASTQFPLTGGHRAVACADCHKAPAGERATAIRYRFDDRSCVACHADPHNGQFKQWLAKYQPRALPSGCEACHSDRAWKDLSRFDHANSEFALLGAHRAVPCASCHKPASLQTTLKNVNYHGAPKRCEECHPDVHGGQFTVAGRVPECAECHNQFKWKPSLFDHERPSTFALKGAHKDVRCSACHKTYKTFAGKSVMMYKPTPTKCVDCHPVTT